jgi:hypothetical protein
MDLPKLWALIRTDLARARQTLPKDSTSHKAIRDYQDFLDHNELELACDMLEAYAEDHEISKEFWLALRDAATKMQLRRANRDETNARNSLDN